MAGLNPPFFSQEYIFIYLKCIESYFPGGAVDKNWPANAGDSGLLPGPGRFHVPWGN